MAEETGTGVGLNMVGEIERKESVHAEEGDTGESLKGEREKSPASGEKKYVKGRKQFRDRRDVQKSCAVQVGMRTVHMGKGSQMLIENDRGRDSKEGQVGYTQSRAVRRHHVNCLAGEE